MRPVPVIRGHLPRSRDVGDHLGRTLLTRGLALGRGFVYVALTDAPAQEDLHDSHDLSKPM
jgi:hypothetical protein